MDIVALQQAVAVAKKIFSRRPTGERVFYVSKGALASDSNDGLSWGSAFATIAAACAAINALTPLKGKIELGYGNWVEAVTLPDGCWITGCGHAMTTITLPNANNGNTIQTRYWGSSTTVGDGGGVEKLAVTGNKANQTLTAASALVTSTVTVSSSSTTVHTNDAAAFNAKGYTSGTVWIGTTLCNFTGLTNLGTFDPANPTTTGWSFTGVTTVSGVTFSATAEMMVLPGNAWGHGIAIQAARFVVRDVLITGTVGSGRAYQASPSMINYECKSFNVRSQQCNRYGIEIGPGASDGMSFGDIDTNAALGALLIAAQDWQFHSYHPGGVFAGVGGVYNARHAPYAITICAGMTYFYGLHMDTFPWGQIVLNIPWYGQPIKTVHVYGDLQGGSWAASGGGAGIACYGTPEGGQNAVQDFRFTGALRGRLLRTMVMQPTSEVVLISGGAYTTPASGGTANKLQVLNAQPFSPLGSAIAGALQITSQAGSALDVVSYTGRSFWTGWVATAAAIGDTSLAVDDASGFAASGTVAVYPQDATEAGVANQYVTYTGKSGNTLTGIPASGTGSIAQAFPAGAGVTQHYLTGVKSTGAGGVSIPDTATVWQNPGTTPHRQVGSVVGSVDADATYHRRLGSPFYPVTSAFLIRNTGRVLERLNPFMGSLTVAIGDTSASVAHNLSAAPTQFGATPNGDPQQRWWVTVDASNITVTLASAASGSAVSFKTWAQNTPA